MEEGSQVTSLAAAREMFVQARVRALREDWLNRLTGKPADLLPYEAVAAVLRSYQHRQLTEVRTIPLDKIVGSVGRYKDFNRRFLPRQRSLAYRWARVEQAMDSSLGVPPIEVYQIGDVYFVLDGNHRVSVARANGFDTIDAYVTVVPVAADIEAGDSLDEAINKAECAHFLAQTRLAEHCKELDIEFTKPGGYPKLLEHIYTHRYFMGLDAPEEGPRITFPAAAADWYANVYLPIVASIRQHGLERRFPGQTPADLYVQVSARILKQSTQQGRTPAADVIVQEIAAQAPSPFAAAMQNLARRLAAHTPFVRKAHRAASEVSAVPTDAPPTADAGEGPVHAHDAT